MDEITKDSIAQLSGERFSELYLLFREENSRRRKEKSVIAVFSIGDRDYPLECIGSDKVRDIKKKLEDDYLVLGGVRIPGPSSNWIYRLNETETGEEEELNNDKCISDYADENSSVFVSVKPPKRKAEQDQIPQRKKKRGNKSSTSSTSTHGNEQVKQDKKEENLEKEKDKKDKKEKKKHKRNTNRD